MTRRFGNRTTDSGAPKHARSDRTAGKARWLALLAVLVWLGISGIGGPLVGRLSEVQKNYNAAFLPVGAESTEVTDQIAGFTDTSSIPYLLVVEAPGALAPENLVTAKELVSQIPTLPLAAIGDKAVIGDYLRGPVLGPVPSQDGAAALIVVNLDAVTAAETLNETTPLYETALALREAEGKAFPEGGPAAYVTGPGGILADFVTIFLGVDGLLLGVALLVVLVILLVVYRSPVLPFAVLLSGVFGLSLAALVIFPLAKADAIDLSGQSQGILFILVVGAATDYALLLVSRYREELHDHESTWVAMRRAWRGAVEPILASGATVILGLLCLLLSDLGSTAGLGPVGALGIVGAMAAALTFLPAVLLLLGRKAFWPLVPRVDHRHAEDALGRRGLWGRVATLVGTHPRRTWVITLCGLLLAAAFLPTFKAKGVSQSDFFLAKVDSVTGQEALGRHFPGGAGNPIDVVTPAAKAEKVLAVLATEEGVTEAAPVSGADGTPTVIDGRVLIRATLLVAADSPEATEVVHRLRGDLDAVGTEVLVGGSTAINTDVLDSTKRDLKVIVPAVLIVIFIVLSLLLRSLVAPLILVVANVISFAATLGIAALVFNHIAGFPGSDPSTPLYGFVFLVALGIDYSIFLMTRVREESVRRSTRPGILVGLAVTGGVITSAGIVLAATFAALGVLPLLFLAQIAFIVAFGVLLDTLIVRSLLVPALAYDLGSRVWWPSRLVHAEATMPMAATASATAVSTPAASTASATTAEAVAESPRTDT